ncbi:ABC transporter ATP-binding protein [Candidatus Sumerlaeota bacterium]|nr:ABC transporter ATP-binding protein [Candidatus Sumerlaeota bacterium]
MLLETDGAGYAYQPGRWALRGITARFEPGTMTGIIGPNGSGKSTLLRLLASIRTPSEGAIRLNGKRLREHKSDALARSIAFMPQTVTPVCAYSCEETVALGRYPHLGAMGFLTQNDLKQIREAMLQTDTLEFAERPLDDLSGGERQRVLLASVLAQQAEFLLLDEPTSALDLHHQHEVMTLLRQFSRNGQCVIVVAHDLNLAAQFCDRLLLLSAGRLEAAGAAEEVLTAERLSPVYGGQIAVLEHPLTRQPLITVLSKKTYE